MNKTALTKKKPNAAATLAGVRQIAAGEFKAKCLRIMDEINATGKSLVVTKRGVPVMKLVPIRSGRKKNDDFFGRLKGIIEIVGDPDDLIKPVFPLENYDMLKRSCSIPTCWCGLSGSPENSLASPRPQFDARGRLALWLSRSLL